MEIKEILESLNSTPEYQGYRYDERIGFHKGPSSFRGLGMTRPIPIDQSEAVIGLRQPISKMAQHHVLLVKRHGKSWKIEKNLGIIEGEGNN